ncbi:hypothetical protein HDU96_000242 [Phlyctochytrium bullatum]|nr:hypothetical protein HDU96_000242 [Phlyctochytrium bullatum]
MIGPGTWSTSLLLLALSLPQPSLQQQCLPYSSSLCPPFTSSVLYPQNTTYIPQVSLIVAPSDPVAAIDRNLTLGGFSLLKAFESQDPDCIRLFQRLICASAFPPCTGAASTPTPLLPCKAACDTTVAKCKPLFTKLGQAANLPDCNGSVLGTGLPYPTTGTCVDTTSNSTTSTPATPANTTIVCPEPFLPITLGTVDNPAPSRRACTGSCCLACPHLNAFYKPGAIDGYLAVTDGLRLASTVGSFIVFLSFLVLPGKRTHPASIILWFSLSLLLFSSSVLFAAGGPHRRSLQCSDPITLADQRTNKLCLAQGTLLLFASHAMCLWCAFLILNLHLATVWNRSLFHTRYGFVHAVCWGLPAVFAGTTLGLGAVRYEFGSLCLVSSEWANAVFFGPLGAVVGVAFVMHFVTVGFIVRVTLQAPNSGGASGGPSTGNSTVGRSGGSGAEGGKVVGEGVSTRTRVAMVWNSSWRSITLAVVLTFTLVLFWILYFLQIAPLPRLTSSPDPFLGAWAACLFTPGGSQTLCSDIARPHVPNYIFMVIAGDGLPSIAGIVIFIVFGCRWSLWEEWRAWYRARTSRVGAGGSIDEPDTLPSPTIAKDLPEPKRAAHAQDDRVRPYVYRNGGQERHVAYEDLPSPTRAHAYTDLPSPTRGAAYEDLPSPVSPAARHPPTHHTSRHRGGHDLPSPRHAADPSSPRGWPATADAVPQSRPRAGTVPILSSPPPGWASPASTPPFASDPASPLPARTSSARRRPTGPAQYPPSPSTQFPTSPSTHAPPTQFPSSPPTPYPAPAPAARGPPVVVGGIPVGPRKSSFATPAQRSEGDYFSTRHHAQTVPVVVGQQSGGGGAGGVGGGGQTRMVPYVVPKPAAGVVVGGEVGEEEVRWR